MRPGDRERAHQLELGLEAFNAEQMALPGTAHHENRLALVEQFVDSIRRVEYVHKIRDREQSPQRADPQSDSFEPLKAAAYYFSIGDVEEACWLVFLSIHFGKHRKTGWRLARDIYGALGSRPPWTWSRISCDPGGIGDWLRAHYRALADDGVPRHFGNHRKYESIRPGSARGTGRVVASYVNWVNEYGGHEGLFKAATEAGGSDRRRAFNWLYADMRVMSFGRLTKFDYLTMLSKLGLAPIEPDSAYLKGATGPLRGARLLFGGSVSANLSARELDSRVIRLADFLGLGMQEMEDALCNWQKSPNRYTRFSG